MILNIKVIPNASKNEIVNYKASVLKVKIHAVPEKGKANIELIKFLSKTWNIPKQSLAIVSGKTSSQKKIKISESEDAKVLKKLASYPH